jgi:condensin complex subunit 1
MLLLNILCLKLLTTLLENNPYMGDLDPEPYRQKLSELYTYIMQNLPDDLREAHLAALAEAGKNREDDEAVAQLERATLAAAIAEAGSMDGTDQELNNHDNEFRSRVEALKFAQSALEFIDQYENASANLQGMLLSANTSDVTEALRFFVKARHFQLPCAVTGMKHALKLMWSTEQNIKDEVLRAFVDVFIALPGTERTEYLPSDQIAYNLLLLAGEATVSELASIDEAIRSLVSEAKIPPEVFSILWSATTQGPGSSRATAIHVLAMAAHADKSIVDSKSRLKTLLDTALGDYTEDRRDWQIVRAAAIALQRVERAQVDPSCAKYLVLERITERLCAVARGDWCIDATERDTTEWFAAAEESIAALFVIDPEPEAACGEIIRGMYRQSLGDSSAADCHPLRLARFFHVLGHIALKLLVYSEDLSGAVRRGTAKRTLRKQEEADKSKVSGTQTSGQDEDIEAELGMDAELEAESERKVAEIAEKEIVGRGLLSIFGSILVRVVANEGNLFNSPLLRQTSTLALCKFMCVSCSFCEKHLPVIFTALANAPADDLTLRANAVIALGDLAFRFPNEVEPYTPRIYACLRDSSTKVRRHTLMVLTHLILNDMVKVKGQVCEIAMCLRDDDQRIRDTARLLFHELSKRSNNPVYNLLPDIISQLSQIQLQKDDFRSIMSFLLGYIKKERQNEMLVDKLCQRFPKCSTIEQKADLAYCMAQLKVNDRSVKILVDNFKLYKDALFDDDVKRHFIAIVSRAKKFAKPELKQALEEFEHQIDEHSALDIENKRAGEKAALAKTQASRRGAGRAKRMEILPECEEDEDGEVSYDDASGDKENDNNRRESLTAVVDSSKRRSRRTRNTTAPLG